MSRDPFEDGVVVSLTGDSYRTEALSGDHRVLLDEPGEAGGENSGPSPIKLMLMSLGGCKAMTARMYAARKGWPLEGVIVSARHELREPEGGGPKRAHIDVELQILGDQLTDEQRERIAEIADRCPVQKMLATETPLDVTHVVADAPPR
ncbi:MAG: OsmC family protein [Planctomycetota bacterium]